MIKSYVLLGLCILSGLSMQSYAAPCSKANETQCGQEKSYCGPHKVQCSQNANGKRTNCTCVSAGSGTKK